MKPAFPLSRLAGWIGLLALLALAFTVRCWNWRQTLVDGQVYFVDADCYSRMTRVQRVMAEPWKSIGFHDFENAPFGTTPHTTAPMDLAIAALAGILRLGIGGFLGGPVDAAGALISPLLGTLFVGFLWWWGRWLKLPFRSAMLFLAAVSPILAHGFLLGRPDHQSLVILLAGAALAMEIALWLAPSRSRHVAAAVLWALALWTSLFEPLILLLASLALRFFTLGKKSRFDAAALAVFAAVLLPVFWFEGWRFQTPAGEVREYFFRWAQNIGELRHASLSQLFRWTGWLLILSPFLLLLRFWKNRERPAAALALLLVLAAGLCFWHMRWGYFLALVFALSLPWMLPAIPWRPAAWTLFAVSLWPMAKEWDGQLFPDASTQAALEENREDAVELRKAALALISPDRSVVLAPWWLSPALAYWSGQRYVAGSSHQSMPGIVDSARFYLSTTAGEARQILEKRQAAYVVAYEPSRIIGNSAQILGHTPAAQPLGKILYENPYAVPDFLRLVYENKYFKIYEVRLP